MVASIMMAVLLLTITVHRLLCGYAHKYYPQFILLSHMLHIAEHVYYNSHIDNYIFPLSFALFIIKLDLLINYY